jgi:hypothetical protein
MAKNKKKKDGELDAGTQAGLAQNDLNESLMGAISEENDPNARLKKLKSPINFLSCLINVVIMIVGTMAIGLFVCSFFIDDFNLGKVFMDVMTKFGITGFFEMIGRWFGGIFGGNKESAALLLSSVGAVFGA